MNNKEQVEYVIANLSEEEIRAVALEKLRRIDADDVLTSYASIKAGYYAKKAEYSAKFDAKIQSENAAKSNLDASKIFS